MLIQVRQSLQWNGIYRILYFDGIIVFVLGVFMAEFGVILLIIVGILIFLIIIDNRANYTEKDFNLKKIEDPKDNTYHFEISLYSFQYRKIQEAKKRYGQNSILYCENDDSYHRVLRWGAKKIGIQRIIAEPCIIENINPGIIYNTYIFNKDFFYIEILEPDDFNKLYQEVLHQNSNVNQQEKKYALEILDDIRKGKGVQKKSLARLYQFFKKHDVLLSCASNLLSIISSILGIIN